MVGMRRHVGAALLASLSLIAAHAAIGAPTAPQGVTYVPASASANVLARTELKSIFSGNKAEFSKLLTNGVAKYGKVIAGVFMTLGFIDSGRLKTATLTEGYTYIPLHDKNKDTLRARIVGAKTAKQADSLASLFYASYAPSGNITISKLTKSDMEFIWFYIGWNISEPIYVIHEQSRKFIFEFGPQGKSLRYMEDLTSPCFRLRSKSHDTPWMCQIVEHKGNVYKNRFQLKKAPPSSQGKKATAKKS